MSLPPVGKQRTAGELVTDVTGVLLLLLFLFLFFNVDYFKEGTLFTVPQSWQNVNVIFLSIVIEAMPFILLGVFVSALIQIYVKEETLQKYLPKNAFGALFPAVVLGAIFPICECAIIPVVRRLIKKGMPLHVGVVFLVAAPILNPVVFASTFFAFRTNLTVLYSRMALAFILAIIIGAILYVIFKHSNQLKRDDLHVRHVHDHEHPDHPHEAHLEDRHEAHIHEQPVQQRAAGAFSMNRVKQTMYHAVDEFFDMGKYLIAGAFIAALFQTFLDRQILLSIGSDDGSSTLVMMAFAYVLSLCSEADAFVAASFGGTFTVGSIIAFLVYGPMLDLKNTIMLFAYFKARFVFAFIAVVTLTVFLAVIGLQWLIL